MVIFRNFWATGYYEAEVIAINDVKNIMKQNTPDIPNKNETWKVISISDDDSVFHQLSDPIFEETRKSVKDRLKALKKVRQNVDEDKDVFYRKRLHFKEVEYTLGAIYIEPKTEENTWSTSLCEISKINKTIGH